MKVAIFPPNSMILADMIVRSGHEPLVVQNEMKQKVLVFEHTFGRSKK